MGIFRKMGRNVEEFAQSVKESADASANYECIDCGERFQIAHDDCTECGGAVEAIESETEDETSETDGAGEGETSEDSASQTDN